MSSEKYDPQNLENILPIYYNRFFPHDLYYKWLSYGNVDKKYFANREFSFTLKDDVYIRYLSFNNQEELKQGIKDKVPYKIDIGAVYNCSPKDHRHLDTFQAIEKEVVIDIDITDYDDVRTCCSGGGICKLCWPLMAIAVKILDTSLRNDFGFEHLLWVFSGRRGVHCWVCDPDARKLTSTARSAIVGYLTLVKGGVYQQKKVHLSKYKKEVKPWILRSLGIIDNYFQKLVLEDQSILETKEQCVNVSKIAFEDHGKYQEEALGVLLKCPSNSLKRWEKLEQLVAGAPALRTYSHIVEEIKLQFCYPRLDINVTKGVNHLLKGPFCVHPKTGQISIPFDPKYVDDLDPTNVVKVTDLLAEMDAFDKLKPEEEGNKHNLKDYQKTSLKASYKVFQMFLNKLENTWKEKLQDQEDKKMEF